jgi:hypothetical protein
MSVAELSEALYGDPDHAVAVRAELSRLRRVLGSILDSRPYRPADTVRLTLALGADSLDCEFACRATSPAVQALTRSVPE